MSNSVISRRPAGPVRQHSLQQPPRRQQQIIRRQRSTDDDKLQFYANEPVNRFNSSKCDFYNHHSSNLDRPKVRVAWSEKLTKSKNDNGVEIVARQIPPGKASRPTTGRPNKNRYPSGEKATILYSRQELAERLRLAWRQREENKANIDIFLAHNTVEERCDSRVSTATSRTNFSTPSPQKKREEADCEAKKNEPNKSETNDLKEGKLECDDKSQKPNTRKMSSWFLPFESKESNTIEVSSKNGLADENLVNPKEKEGRKEEEEEENEENPKEEEPITSEKKSTINIDCTRWNSTITLNETTNEINNTLESKPISKPEPDYSSAKAKRASFRSGQNKAFVGPIVEKPSTPRISSRSSSLQDLPRIFRRTNSAPPQRKTQVNIVIDASSISTETIQPTQDEQPTTFKNSNRSIKSAPPVKRRAKANKRRVAGKEELDDSKSKTKGPKGGVRLSLEAKGNPDVVTMVSLVSSAESESEMDENSPRDDKLICELRSKLPTTPIIKSSNGLSPGIRKPFKSGNYFTCTLSNTSQTFSLFMIII